MDGQHKTLLGIINDLYAVLIDSTDRRPPQALLDRLASYTTIHFEREEEIMEECQFPDIKAHRALHARMKAKTVQLRQAGRGPPNRR